MTRDRPTSARSALHPRELAAARLLLGRIDRSVDADLVQASLFGSRARGDARPDSDIDLLLVFRWLPEDREPQASHAEDIAESVAAETAVPLTVWSVSLIDLERGRRTPMLVDALADGLTIWCAREPIPPVQFTPEDAVRCAGSLLDRVDEGEDEVGWSLDDGDVAGAAARVRDDLVRMCVGLHLLRGETRPRRGDAARRLLRVENGTLPAPVRDVLGWAARSYGPHGRDDEAPVPPPPDPAVALRSVGHLRRLVAERRARLARALHEREPLG